MAEARHRWAVRVYYEDTDAAGIVYYANYLKFAERARTEWLRDLGFDHTTLRPEGVWAVRRLAADYRRPARLDDLLSVETTLVALGGASADLLQTVTSMAGEHARLRVGLAFVAPDGRPRRLPAAVRQALGPLTNPLTGV